MFFRNGQALGSVNSAELKAAAARRPEPPDVPPVDVPSEQRVLSGTETAVGERPAVADRKSDWVDFAVSQGAARAEAEGLTKAELVELYGDDGDH